MTNKKQDKVDRSEEEILFPEVEVAGIMIKPWSFGVLFEIGPLLEQVLDKMDEKEIEFGQDFISYKTIARLFTLASDPLLKIISLTTNRDEDEIKKLSLSDGIKIAFLIYNQNREQIVKNLTSPTQK